MNHCRTCVWWTPTPKEDWDDITGPWDPDTLEPMKLPFEVRQCKQPDQTFCERPLNPDNFALADGSNYRANLYTAEDFGCVLHQPTKGP